MQDTARGTEWPLERDPEAGYDWDRLTKGGRNRFFLIILALRWWKGIVKSSSEQLEHAGAIEETAWVLGEIVQDLRSNKTLTKRPTDSPKGGASKRYAARLHNECKALILRNSSRTHLT